MTFNVKQFVDIILIVAVAFSCLYLPLEQLFIWLKTGQYVSRDFFWLIGEEETLISSPYVQITDWVGVNKILNYLFDVHLGIITFLLGWAWLSIRLKEEDKKIDVA